MFSYRDTEVRVSWDRGEMNNDESGRGLKYDSSKMRRTYNTTVDARTSDCVEFTRRLYK